MSMTKQEKRAYQRMVSGLSIANHRSAFMRFMTLTTAPNSKKDINKSFDALKKRIFRAAVEKDGFRGFKFNRYFKLKTAEGYGVLHIVYWGLYIPQEWLSNAWTEIHQSPIVHIEACYGGPRRNVKGLVGYLLTNYLTKQPIIRMSYGWKWAWLGFCKSWKHIKQTGLIRAKCRKDYEKPHGFVSFKEKYRNVALSNWGFLMREPLPTTRQIKFCNPSHDRLKIFRNKCFGGWEYYVNGVKWVFNPLSRGKYQLFT